MTTIYVCKDNFEDILCGIYDAWYSKLGHDNVKVQVEHHGNIELFSRYIDVIPQEDKVSKVIRAVRQKISEDAYEAIYKVALSNDKNKADWMYRFLIEGFKYGKGVIDMLNIESVFEVFRIARFVTHENHLFTGFVRFFQMKQGILLSKIQPQNNILPMLALHFSDRLSGEHWIIYDENRQTAVFHTANGDWVIVKIESEEWRSKLIEDTNEEEYQQLWKVFFQSVAINERTNSRRQLGHLPLRYRANMPEFEV